MIKYTKNDIIKSLDELKVEEGDTLFIQTSLMDLGIMINCKIDEIPRVFFNVIQDRIGPQGTICAQGFTLKTCKEEAYSPTQASECGAFSEYVRQLPGSIRSPHPIQSIIAIGKNAQYICENDTFSGYDKNGPYGKMLEIGTKLLLIGRNRVDTCSYAHYAEEKMSVPYRYWKTFSIDYMDYNDIPTKRDYGFYVRDLQTNPIINLKPIVKDMISTGVIKSSKLGASDMRIADAKKIVEHITKTLALNPWAMVENHNE